MGTITITHGVHADFDRNKKLIGIEVLDASEIIERKLEFEFQEPALSRGKG